MESLRTPGPTLSSPALQPLVPRAVGPYRIEKQLGQGGMGVVFRGHHERLGRPVALKRLRREAQRDARVRERFLREARTAARLTHPNVAQVYDIVDDGGDLWIVMELVEGIPLYEVLESGPIGVAPGLSLTFDIARGLAAAHAQNIVHRDLKAENVMVTPCERAKILDFGIARLQGPGEDTLTLSATGQLVGTPRAMSPEQAKGRKVDHRSDLFSLGSLIYEALTGIAPFHSSQGFVHTLKLLCIHSPPPMHELDARIPPALSSCVDHLLQKDPNLRPQSAGEFLAALQHIVMTQPRTGEAGGGGRLGPRYGPENPAVTLRIRIVGLQELAESLSSPQAVGLLNRLFAETVRVTNRCGGTLVEYLDGTARIELAAAALPHDPVEAALEHAFDLDRYLQTVDVEKGLRVDSELRLDVEIEARHTDPGTARLAPATNGFDPDRLPATEPTRGAAHLSSSQTTLHQLNPCTSQGVPGSATHDVPRSTFAARTLQRSR